MPRRKRRAAPSRRRRTRRVRTSPIAKAATGGAVRSLQACRAELVAQCSALTTQIEAVDRVLNLMGGSVAARPAAPVAGRPGRRPRGSKGYRPGSLKDYIARVLGSGGVMAVKDIAAGVTDAGYESSNKTLAKSVGIALTEMPTVRKVGRGRFRVK